MLNENAIHFDDTSTKQPKRRHDYYVLVRQASQQNLTEVLMSTQTISAVMPCWNGGKFLSSAIKSILNQTLAPDEIILFDNKSSDNSLSIMQTFARKDSRIRVIANNSRLPVSKSLATTIAAATSDYVAVFHADDISCPMRLERQASCMGSDVGAVSSFLEEIDGKGRAINLVQYPTSPETLWETMLSRNVIPQAAVLLNRRIFDSAGGIRSGPLPFADYDLFLRMLEQGTRICVVPEYLVQYRVHDGQDSARIDTRLLWEKFNVLLSAASRRLLQRDLMAEDSSRWDSFAFKMLPELVTESVSFTQSVGSYWPEIKDDWHRVLAARNQAIAILQEAPNYFCRPPVSFSDKN